MEGINLSIESCKNPQILIIHTDFNIQGLNDYEFKLCAIKGLEPLDHFGLHKYRFSVEFGTLFDKMEIIQSITDVTKTFFKS